MLVLEKGWVECAVGFPHFAVLLLENETGSTKAKGNTEANNLPRLRLTLPPCKELVLAADLVSEGKDFGAVELLFHILFAFDGTNIRTNICQLQINVRKFADYFRRGQKSLYFYSMKSRDYKKEHIERRISILNGDGELIGVWGNLKKLCEDMKEQDGEFLSYSTLSHRRADENPIRFKTGQKEYAVYIEKIR